MFSLPTFLALEGMSGTTRRWKRARHSHHASKVHEISIGPFGKEANVHGFVAQALGHLIVHEAKFDFELNHGQPIWSHVLRRLSSMDMPKDE